LNTGILTTYRFFAAALVVMFHFAHNTRVGQAFPVLIESGPEMVTFFFVLSGFIMGVTCLPDEHFKARQYWVRRFSRIYPAYLLAALAMLLLFPKQGLANGSLAALLHLLMLQAWLPHAALAVNGPGWSLSVEMFFYAILPLLVLAVRRKPPQRQTLFALAFGLWLITQLLHLYCLNATAHDSALLLKDAVLYFPLSHLCSFVLGFAGYYYLAQRPTTALAPWQSDLLVLSALIVVIAVLAHEQELAQLVHLELPFESSLLSPLFLLLILTSVRNTGVMSRLLTRPFALQLGEASYGIYILQKPAWLMYKNWLYPRLNSGLHWHLSNDIHFCLYLALLIVAAWSIQTHIENPLKNRIRRRFQA